MKIYPSIREYYYSPLSPEELPGRLRRNTSSAWFEFSSQEFKGETGTAGFTLRRLSWYTNVNNRPNIIGQVKVDSVSTGSKVVLCQRLWLIGYWISVFISLVIATLLSCALGSNISGAGGIVLGLLAGITVFSLALASVLVPFWLAVKAARTLLVNMLLLQAATSL